MTGTMATDSPPDPADSTESLVTLDCRGLICPLPVLRTRKALSRMSGGEQLRVLTTDRAAPRDMQSFCQSAGHRLIMSEESGQFTTMLIEKAE
jgi:tRNA 2-thiouridine synthesizing protein A